MNIEIQLWNIIDLLSFSAAFMIGLLFLTKKSKNRIANIFLALFLWSLSLEILMTFLEDIGIFEFQFTTVLTIPLLLTYIIKTLNQPIKFKYIFLLIPLICEPFGIIPSIINYILIIIILFYTLKIIKNSDEKLNEFYSNLENKAMLWIKHIIYIYLFFYGFWLLEDLIGLWFEEITLYFAALSSILTLLMVYWIGYNGFSQSEIFSINLTAFPIQKTEKIKGTKTNDNENLEMFNSLSEVIKKNKLFTQKDLTIRNLSSKLNINERTFSKLISEYTNNNFYHYINKFRVEEFKNLLQTDRAKQITLIGLSEEAGFNSKSTFYTAFKYAEGITPKQYQEKIKGPNDS